MLAARLAELTGWGLLIFCECRRHPRHVPLADIAKDHGNRMTLGTVLRRLRCRHCGRKPLRVDGVHGDPFGTRPWRVKLMDPEGAARHSLDRVQPLQRD